MRIKILKCLSMFSERVIFFFLYFPVVVLCLVALKELGPFYAYGLNATIVQVMAQGVSGIHRAIFKFSLDLYIWYACTWMFVVVALGLIRLVGLYLNFFFNIRLKEKHATRRFFSYIKRVLVPNVKLSLCRRLVRLVEDSNERSKKKHCRKVASEEVPKRGKEWKTYAWHISLIFILALVIFTYRYALFPVPQGWDTWQYTYVIRDMQRDITLVTTNLPRAMSLIIMYVITSASGLMIEQVMVLLTPLIGIIYMLGVYLLVLTGIKNKVVALLAALYTPLTFGTIMLSAGFYSNYFAWGFAMYALTLYIKTMETKETKMKYVVPTAMMFTLTAFTHIWAFMFLTAIVLAQSLFELLATGEYRRTIQRILIIYTPSIIVTAIIAPNQILGVLRSLGLFSASNPWENAPRENPYMLLLAIIGIVAILKYKGTTYTRLVLSWTMLTSIVLITGISYFPQRIMCVVPIAILAAHGTQVISNRITQHLNSKSMGKPILPLIFLLSFTAMVPSSYLPEAALTPPSEAMQQLYWIEQHYGFGNGSVIVCFDRIPPSVNGLYYSDYYSWGLATVGGVLYDAPVLYLIQGLADSHENRFQDFSGKTIIIPDEFYRMTSIEYVASRKISDLGIYEVQFKSIAQVDQIIRNESIWLEDSFEIAEWTPNPQPIDYDYQITNESSILNISITPLHSDRWFNVEKRLLAPIHPTSQLILKAKGNIDSLDFIVGALSDTDWIAWTDFSRYMTSAGYTYLMMDLNPDIPISRIRLSILSANVTSIESYLQVDYIAIV